MREGYCIGDGEDYYCTDECLHKEITEDEYIELYKRDVAYWTEWECEDDK
ncbi:hypothetical protein SH2C18_20050 [Clostridium sediminicola]